MEIVTKNLNNKKDLPKQAVKISFRTYILTAQIRQVKFGYGKMGGTYEQFSKKHAHKRVYAI
jgi:hypothetical protein